MSSDFLFDNLGWEVQKETKQHKPFEQAVWLVSLIKLLSAYSSGCVVNGYGCLLSYCYQYFAKCEYWVICIINKLAIRICEASNQASPCSLRNN